MGRKLGSKQDITKKPYKIYNTSEAHRKQSNPAAHQIRMEKKRHKIKLKRRAQWNQRWAHLCKTIDPVEDLRQPASQLTYTMKLRQQVLRSKFCIETREKIPVFSNYDAVGGIAKHTAVNINKLFTEQLCTENIIKEIQCTDTTCHRQADQCPNRLFGQKCSENVRKINEPNRGSGVLALEFILALTFIGEYYGEIIGGQKASKLQQKFLRDMSQGCYILKIGKSKKSNHILHVNATSCVMSITVC